MLTGMVVGLLKKRDLDVVDYVKFGIGLDRTYLFTFRIIFCEGALVLVGMALLSWILFVWNRLATCCNP